MGDLPRNYSGHRIDVDSANRVLVPPLVSSPTAISEIDTRHNVFDSGFAGREGDEENNDFQINTTRDSTSRHDTQPDELDIHADTVVTEKALALPSEQVERTRPSETLPRYRIEMTHEQAVKYFEWRKEQDREARTPATTETGPAKRGFSLKSLFSRRESKSPASQVVTKSFVNIELHCLRNFIAPTLKPIPSKVQLKAISATGNKVAVLSTKSFWVFNTDPVSLECSGDFTNGKKAFQYAPKSETLETQHPIPLQHAVSPFQCAAVSDAYLAIGCAGRVMVFIVEGAHSGRWVMLNCFRDEDALIEKLAFSLDGDHLVAIVKLKSGNSRLKMITYTTTSFLNEPLHRCKLIRADYKEIALKDWEAHCARGVAFANDCMTMAIYTNYVKLPTGLQSGIQLFRKINNVWELWGKFHIVQFPYNKDTDWDGEGITDIALYFPSELLANQVFIITSIWPWRQIQFSRKLQIAWGSMHRRTVKLAN